MADKKVVVYSTAMWPWCHRAREYLSQKGVDFEDYDVGVDREKAMEMVRKTGQMGVPVIIIGNEIIIGFNQREIDRLLP